MRVPFCSPRMGPSEGNLEAQGQDIWSHLLLQVGLLLLHQLAHPLGLHCLFEELFPRQDTRPCQKLQGTVCVCVLPYTSEPTEASCSLTGI